MKLLLDTHVLVWLLEDSTRISDAAYAQLQQAANEDQLLVSAITPWEIALLDAKGRVKLTREVGDWLDAALGLPGIHLEPLSPAIAVASTRLPGDIHGDPADRILVATARHVDATLVTADQQLLTYAAQGFLKCMPPA
ncbi:MAG TPA: type II toxin-antitoxin system VapC family toxin [Terracidiphilus sp.]|nr:type II toxin-antitoxin system VapC family toxin [Terracidiphilus sp.]